MGKHNAEFKSYLLARSVYGTMKRYSEKLATRLGKKFGKDVYILRLGEVHGELQSVSRKFLNEIKDEIAYIPDAHSYTVFPYTIAEALINIAQGKEKTGRYTVVSEPEWSWKEIHEYYCKKVNINPTIVLFNYSKNTNSNYLQCIILSIKNKILELVNHYVEIIASYFLSYFPKLEKKLMAKFYIQKAKSQIAEYKNNRRQYKRQSTKIRLDALEHVLPGDVIAHLYHKNLHTANNNDFAQRAANKPVPGINH